MTSFRLIIFAVIGLAQLSVPASVIWKREQTLRQGRVWKFKTAPVDPIDAIRGRYVALRFDAETVPHSENTIPGPVGTTMYVTLKEDAQGFAQVDHLNEMPITGDNVMKVKQGYASKDNEYRVVFPFNRFWVTEDDAAAAEKAYFENSRQGKQNAYAAVRVRESDAAIEDLFIDNQPLREYLRAHPQ